MPRSITGIYTLPQPAFVAGTTIQSASVNSDFSDIATALTQSLATTGVSSMTGPIKAFTGTVGQPSYSFASDLTTGFYLSAAGQVSFSSESSQIATFDDGGITLLDGEFIDKTGQIVRPIPIGFTGGWPANKPAPDGWFLQYGQTVAIATYPALFDVLGTTYGGDGVTTFGIPDKRGRVGIGRDDMGGVPANRITNAGCGIVGTTIGATGGAQSYTFLQANLPSLNWTVTDPGHAHAFVRTSGTSVKDGGGSPCGLPNLVGDTTASATTGISVASGGSGTPFAIVPPAIIENMIIYHGVFS